MRNQSDNEKLLLLTKELILGRLQYTVNDRLRVLSAYLKTRFWSGADSAELKKCQASKKSQNFFQISSQN